MAWTASLPADAHDAVTGSFDNTLILAESWKALAAAGRPAALPIGGMYLDGSDATVDVFRFYADLKGTGAADYEVGRVHFERIEMIGATRADRSYYNLCVELRASHPTPAAALQGHVYEYSGDGRLYVVVDLGGPSYAKRCVVTAGATDFHQTWLPADSWRADLTNPPVAAEKGNAAGYSFRDTSDLLKCRIRVPLAWDGATAPKVRLTSVIEGAGESNGDDEHWRVRYKSLAPNASALANAALESATVAHDLGTSVAEFAVNTHEISLDPAKLTRGHELLLLLDVPTHGGAGNIGDRLFIGGEILWPVGAQLTE